MKIMENVKYNVSISEVKSNIAHAVNMYIDSSDRRKRLKARIWSNELNILNNAEMLCDTHIFKRLQINADGSFNRGDVFEQVILDWYCKDKENDYCEVKYFGNETPNILVNSDTKRVVLVINKATLQGVYSIRNMKVLINQRVGLQWLIDNKMLKPLKRLSNALFGYHIFDNEELPF